MLGSFHAIREKHAPRYLTEIEYRFNRHFNFPEMIERLRFVALCTSPMPYRLLRMAEFMGNQEIFFGCLGVIQRSCSKIAMVQGSR